VCFATIKFVGFSCASISIMSHDLFESLYSLPRFPSFSLLVGHSTSMASTIRALGWLARVELHTSTRTLYALIFWALINSTEHVASQRLHKQALLFLRAPASSVP